MEHISGMEYKHKLAGLIPSVSSLPTFNFYTLSQLRGILAAIREAGRPALVGISQRCWNTFDKTFLGWAVSEYIPEMSNELGFAHLDHGWSMEAVREAIGLGFRSVMFDGSKMEIGKNIELSRKAYDYARKHDVCIEGEVGIVGRPGLDSTKTSETEAIRFYEEVPVDYLAISIGTFHGAEPDEFDTGLARRVHEETGARLALHGGSGVGDENLKKALENGFFKYNFASDIDRTEQKIYSGLDEDYLSRKSNTVQKTVTEKVKAFCLNKFEILS